MIAVILDCGEYDRQHPFSTQPSRRGRVITGL